MNGKQKKELEKISSEIERKISEISSDCQSIVRDFIEYIGDDVKKTFSDNMKNWTVSSGSIMWVIFIYILYKFIPQLFGFSYKTVNDVNGSEGVLLFLITICSAMMLLSQFYVLVSKAVPYSIGCVVDPILNEIENIKKYKINDDDAKILIDSCVKKQRIFIIMSYEKTLNSMFSKKENILLFDFVVLAVIMISMAAFVSKREMISACYPKTMDELILDPTGEKCSNEIKAWKLRKTPEKIKKNADKKS
ncbi:hypothetical protein [Acetobacter sp.]|jgi:hypothetical protein|uniref:hypothetical protein n=1 Tax=Acetobacter sp. TaxID=440 RepID=UPI0025B9B512|nr:hypothetical protein [Acetobacter sp.]MCH4092149.1 hypothetical protein [Acetobacter sp.]MCI1299934.1 hypothetical protein [Acetobacter sp.]MCI1315952.1 hypothetical protein [Acetobacter sp.]